jgi:drug/metabolite transporter (DMT)-like permease
MRQGAANQGNLPAIGWMLTAIFLFAVMDALVKWQGAIYPVLQVMFFRSAIGLLVLVGPLMHGGRSVLATRHPWLHLLRGLLGLASLIGFFAAFATMQFGDVYAISFAAPLFVAALSVPLLGEQVGWRRWIAVVAGLAGIVVMVRPGGGVFDWMALVALGGTLAYALAIIMTRHAVRTENNASIVFYSGLIATLASGAALAFVWQTPAWADLPWLIGVGLTGGIAHIVRTQALRLAPASVVTPFEYSGMIWATLLGWVVWQEIPDGAFYAGAILVIGSGLYILKRETARGKAPTEVVPGENA